MGCPSGEDHLQLAVCSTSSSSVASCAPPKGCQRICCGHQLSSAHSPDAPARSKDRNNNHTSSSSLQEMLLLTRLSEKTRKSCDFYCATFIWRENCAHAQCMYCWQLPLCLIFRGMLDGKSERALCNSWTELMVKVHSAKNILSTSTILTFRREHILPTK